MNMIADISNTKLKSHQSYSNLPYYTTSRLHFSFAVYYFLSLYNNTNNDIKRSSNMYLGPYQTSMVQIYENSQHTQTIRRQFADELFECVCPFCGIGA